MSICGDVVCQALAGCTKNQNKSCVLGVVVDGPCGGKTKLLGILPRA